MFSLATNFNQNLCGWDTSQVTNSLNMFDRTKCPNYSLNANTKCQSCL